MSGDLLGAELILALKQRFPQARFYGVAGPRMAAAGCEVIESIEALSVMGLAEVLPALPRLLRLRADLLRRFVDEQPALFIGIDAPDFNLGLALRLRQRGLRTVQMVSPTVWAWRQGRVRTIARAVDRILCLFPFEPTFYAQHQVRADYIGHPLADQLDDSVTTADARRALHLAEHGPVLAVLPGSRGSEIRHLAGPFARSVAQLQRQLPGLRVLTPVAKPSLRAPLQAALDAHAPGVDWRLLDGQSRGAMQAADAVLLASGTATLECLLLGRPMAVAYRGSAITAWLMLRAGLLKTRYISLPNLLSETPMVREFLQNAVTPEQLVPELLRLLTDRTFASRQLQQFERVREHLRCDAATRAAEVIDRLLQESAHG